MFKSPAFLQGMKGVSAGITLAPGLIVLTGKSGTGKSLLLSQVISSLPSTVLPLLLDSHILSYEDFIEFLFTRLTSELEAPKSEASIEVKVSALLDHLAEQQRQGHSVALFIDDAHTIAEDLLVNLLQLSNTQNKGDKLIQIVLFGQPILEQKLATPKLRELSHDRIALTLPPLQSEEVGEFIRQSLEGMEVEDKGIFSDEAIESIASYSRGIPQLINTLCSLALLTDQFKQNNKVTHEIVDEVAKSLMLEPNAPEEKGMGNQAVDRSLGTETTPTAEPIRRYADQPVIPETKTRTVQQVDLGKRQEPTMSRLDNLNKILKRLQTESPGVEASALISEDGLMIASSLPQELEETRVAGMTATLLNLGTRSASELRRGEVQEVIVRGEHGYVVMISAGRGALLLVLANETSKLGLIFFDMREAIKAIKSIL